MKTYKLTTEKVDTLKHISDHGLNVEFTDSKRKKLLEEIRRIDFGKIVLSAKNSDLMLWKSGEVLFVKAKFARHADQIACEFASISQNKGSLGELSVFYKNVKLYAAFNSLSWKLLKRTVMHEDTSDLLKISWGVTLDKWRGLLVSDGWVMLGETGLKAYSLSLDRKGICEKRDSLKRQIEFGEKQLRGLSDEAQETLVKEAECRIEAKKKEVDEIAASFEDKLKIVKESSDPEKIRMASGLWTIQSFETNEGKKWKMMGEKEKWSHDLIVPNYKARIEGDSIVLSSGIKCDLSHAAVLNWLKGKGDAPLTRYGRLTRIDARNAANEPISLVQCGCHRIAVENLGDEWATAMRPTHKPELIEGTPSLFWESDSEAIRKKAEERLSESEKESRNRCAMALRALREDLDKAVCSANPEKLELKRNDLKNQIDLLMTELDQKNEELSELGTIDTLSEARATAVLLTKAFNISL